MRSRRPTLAAGDAGHAAQRRHSRRDQGPDRVGDEVLGVPVSPADLPAVDEGRIEFEPSHGLAGNPGRFRSGTIELRRDDGWTTEMPSTDRAVVTALTLPLLRAYGYPATTGPTTPTAYTPTLEKRSNT